MDLDCLLGGVVAEETDRTPKEDGEFRRTNELSRSEARRDRGRPSDTSVFILRLKCKGVHLGFSVNEVRSQPLQLHFEALMFAKLALVRLQQVYNAILATLIFLIILMKSFLYLDAVNDAA